MPMHWDACSYPRAHVLCCQPAFGQSCASWGGWWTPEHCWSPLLQHPLKHQIQLTARCGHAYRRICFGQVTMEHPTFCYFLVIISFTTSASLSCGESTTLPKIFNLVCIISLHGDYILGHCKRQEKTALLGSLSKAKGPTLTHLYQCFSWHTISLMSFFNAFIDGNFHLPKVLAFSSISLDLFLEKFFMLSILNNPPSV